MNNKVASSVAKGVALIATCTFGACDALKQDKQVHDTKSGAVLAEEKTQEKLREATVSTNIQKLDSGLVIETLKEAGQGAVAPEARKRVTVHYTGWLDVNGKRGEKFDSSVDRGEPFTFILGVGQVIRGWDEGVALMKVGQKCVLTIPPHLGYGSRGAGRVIPPNATLIFEVELLSIA